MEALLPAVQEKPDNPLDLIKKVKKMGILGLVLEDPSSVSMKELVKKGACRGAKAGKRRSQLGTGKQWSHRRRDFSGVSFQSFFQRYGYGGERDGSFL